MSKITDKGITYYVLPGGGQEVNELLIDTVKREVMEELGINIESETLLFIIENMDREPFIELTL